MAKLKIEEMLNYLTDRKTIVHTSGNYKTLTYNAYTELGRITLKRNTAYLIHASTISNIGNASFILTKLNFENQPLTYWLYNIARGTMNGGGGLHQSLYVVTKPDEECVISIQTYGTVQDMGARENCIAIPLPGKGYEIQ